MQEANSGMEKRVAQAKTRHLIGAGDMSHRGPNVGPNPFWVGTHWFGS